MALGKVRGDMVHHHGHLGQL